MQRGKLFGRFGRNVGLAVEQGDLRPSSSAHSMHSLQPPEDPETSRMPSGSGAEGEDSLGAQHLAVLGHGCGAASWLHAEHSATSRSPAGASSTRLSRRDFPARFRSLGWALSSWKPLRGQGTGRAAPREADPIWVSPRPAHRVCSPAEGAGHGSENSPNSPRCPPWRGRVLPALPPSDGDGVGAGELRDVGGQDGVGGEDFDGQVPAESVHLDLLHPGPGDGLRLAPTDEAGPR